MIILLEYPLKIKKYIEFIKSFNEVNYCPCCGRVTRKHGKYERTVHFKTTAYRIPIMRRRCPDCEITFSLLPSFIFPWGRFSNPIYEFFGRLLAEGIPISQLAEKLTTPAISVISSKTLYRWKRRYLNLWGKWTLSQRKKWADELQEGEGLLPFYRLGLTSNEEIQLLLTFYFGESGVPCKGRLFSMINLRQPFPHW